MPRPANSCSNCAVMATRSGALPSARTAIALSPDRGIPRQRFGMRKPAGFRIPNLCRGIPRSGDNAIAVRAEGSAPDLVAMTAQFEQLFAGRGIPDARRLIGRGGYDARAVRAERSGLHRA